MQALRALETAGRIVLPAPRHHHRRCRPRRLGRPAPPPVDVPERVDQVRGLQLVEAVDEAQWRLWNELVGCEHPRGAVQHAGAQVRCRNLASKSLSLALRRLPSDCQRRCGYRPLLVEPLSRKTATRAPRRRPRTGCASARPPDGAASRPAGRGRG